MAKIRNTTDQRRRYVESSAKGQVEVGGLQYELNSGDFQMIADALEILSPDSRKATARAHDLCATFRTLAEHDGSSPEGSKKRKLHKIFVTVSGGVAESCDDTVPKGYALEVVDLDNIKAGDQFPSPEAEARFKNDL
jgi:hypothetical protein